MNNATEFEISRWSNTASSLTLTHIVIRSYTYSIVMDIRRYLPLLFFNNVSSFNPVILFMVFLNWYAKIFLRIGILLYVFSFHLPITCLKSYTQHTDTLHFTSFTVTDKKRSSVHMSALVLKHSRYACIVCIMCKIVAVIKIVRTRPMNDIFFTLPIVVCFIVNLINIITYVFYYRWNIRK